MSCSIDVNKEYTPVEEEKGWFFFRYHIISENVIFPWLKEKKNISEKSIFVNYEFFDWFQYPCRLYTYARGERYHIISENVIFPWLKFYKNISEKSIFVDYETFDRFQF